MKLDLKKVKNSDLAENNTHTLALRQSSPLDASVPRLDDDLSQMPQIISRTPSRNLHWEGC
jgi:hypothetical protein